MKNTIVSIFTVICFFSFVQDSFSQSNIKQVYDTNIIQAQIPDSINKFLNKYNKYINDHNLQELARLYADNFMSGDGLNKKTILKLVGDTWTNYPDIKDTSIVKNIRVSDNNATIETFDKTSGISSTKSEITNDTGILENESHNLMYLQKSGKNWKIISDKIIYEKTSIKFGSAKNMNANLSAPEQAQAGEDYTATLTTNVPNGIIAIASITREPIVFPETAPLEVYRQLSPGNDCLERVMKANTTNNNELATASIGYTELTDDILTNPEVKLTGMMILLTRVNVIPQSTFKEKNDKLKIEHDIENDALQEKTENE